MSENYKPLSTEGQLNYVRPMARIIGVEPSRLVCDSDPSNRDNNPDPMETIEEGSSIGWF